MSNFSISVSFVLQNEGGFSNDPDDNGSVTKFGITANYLMGEGLLRYDLDGDSKIGVEDMRHFTRDDAINVYKRWWLNGKFDLIKNTEIAKRVFDFAINAGQYEAIKIFQASLNDVSNIIIVYQLVEDGILGPSTAELCNSLCDESVVKLLGTFKTKRYNFYLKLVEKNPADEKFINGWKTRAYK